MTEKGEGVKPGPIKSRARGLPLVASDGSAHIWAPWIAVAVCRPQRRRRASPLHVVDGPGRARAEGRVSSAGRLPRAGLGTKGGWAGGGRSFPPIAAVDRQALIQARRFVQLRRTQRHELRPLLKPAFVLHHRRLARRDTRRAWCGGGGGGQVCRPLCRRVWDSAMRWRRAGRAGRPGRVWRARRARRVWRAWRLDHLQRAGPIGPGVPLARDKGVKPVFRAARACVGQLSALRERGLVPQADGPFRMHGHRADGSVMAVVPGVDGRGALAIAQGTADHVASSQTLPEEEATHAPPAAPVVELHKARRVPREPHDALGRGRCCDHLLRDAGDGQQDGLLLLAQGRVGRRQPGPRPALAAHHHVIRVAEAVALVVLALLAAVERELTPGGTPRAQAVHGHAVHGPVQGAVHQSQGGEVGALVPQLAADHIPSPRVLPEKQAAHGAPAPVLVDEERAFRVGAERHIAVGRAAARHDGGRRRWRRWRRQRSRRRRRRGKWGKQGRRHRGRGPGRRWRPEVGPERPSAAKYVRPDAILHDGLLVVAAVQRRTVCSKANAMAPAHKLPGVGQAHLEARAVPPGPVRISKLQGGVAPSRAPGGALECQRVPYPRPVNMGGILVTPLACVRW